MKKAILVIGIIALFIGIAFVPSGTSVKERTNENQGLSLQDPSYLLYLEEASFQYAFHSIPRYNLIDDSEFYLCNYWFVSAKGTITLDDSYLGSINLKDGDYIEAFMFKGSDADAGDEAIKRGHHESLSLGGSGILVILIDHIPA